MPSGNLDFRTVCGRFVSVFMVFMSKRALGDVEFVGDEPGV